MAQAGLRIRAVGVIVGSLSLCACAQDLDTRSAEARRLPPLQAFPGSLLLPAPSAAHLPLPDTCGARALAGLVGRSRTQIPIPVDLSRRRVACTACPVAPDVRLDRVNILFDAQSGTVTKITCG